MNTMEIRDHWDTIQGQLRARWGQLTDDDLQIVGGNLDQVIGRIEQKTGETRRSVERFLNDLVESGERFGAKARHVAERAGEVAAENYQQAADEFRRQAEEQYERAERYVQEHPAQSMALVFGCGIVAGLALAALLRNGR